MTFGPLPEENFADRTTVNVNLRPLLYTVPSWHYQPAPNDLTLFHKTRLVSGMLFSG